MSLHIIEHLTVTNSYMMCAFKVLFRIEGSLLAHDSSAIEPSISF